MANYIHWYYKALYSHGDAQMMLDRFRDEDIDAEGFCCGKPLCDAKLLNLIDLDNTLLQADGWCMCESMLELDNPEISSLRSLGPSIHLDDEFIPPKSGIIVWQTEGYADEIFAASIPSLKMPSGNSPFAKDEKGNVWNRSSECVYINGSTIDELKKSGAKELEFVSEDKDNIIFNIGGKTIKEKKLSADEFDHASNSTGTVVCHSNSALEQLRGKSGTLHFELSGLKYRIFAGMNSETLTELIEDSDYVSDFMEFFQNPDEETQCIMLGARSEYGDICTVVTENRTFEFPINTFEDNENADIPAMVLSKGQDSVLSILCGGTTVEDRFFFGSEVNSILEINLPTGQYFDPEKFKWKTVSFLNCDGSLLARMVIGASYNGKNVKVMRTDAYTSADDDEEMASVLYIPENVELPEDNEMFSRIIRYNPSDKKKVERTFSKDFYDVSKEEYIVNIIENEFTDEDGELMLPAEIAQKSEYFSDKLFEANLRMSDEDFDEDEDE